MQTWQHWAILSLKNTATVIRRPRRHHLREVKLSTEAAPGAAVGEKEKGFGASISEAVKLILIIGLGVALGELLVRFVWSILIWQYIIQNLP